MTDTTQAPPQIVLDLNTLKALGAEIAVFDEQITAATGSEAQMKNSVLTRVATENDADVSRWLDSFVTELAKLETPVLAGFLHRFADVTNERFLGRIDELVNAELSKLKANVAGTVEPLKEQRKAKFNLFQAMRAILEQSGADVSSVPVPKRSAGGGRSSGGGSGRSGSRATGWNTDELRFTMDGKNRPPSQNTFSSLAYYATMGCAGTEEAPDRWGAPELRTFLESKGAKIEKGATWEVELPNGTKVGARPLNENDDKDIYDLVRAKEEAEASDDDNGDDDNGSENTPATPAPAPVTDPDAPTAPVDDDGMPVQ